MKTDDTQSSQSNVLTYRWLVGILVLAVFGLTSAWAMEISARMTRAENSISEIRSEFRAFSAGQTAEHKGISEKLTELTAAIKEMRK